MTDRFSETMDVIESYIRAVGGEKQDEVLAKCSEARSLFAIPSKQPSGAVKIAVATATGRAGLDGIRF
jgi:hypothetical protein